MDDGAVTIQRVTPKVVSVLTNISEDMPCIAYVAVQHGKIIGSGGLCRMDSRWWLWFEVYGDAHRNPVTVVRWGRLMLKKAQQLGMGTVYAAAGKYAPKSGKLLSLVGLKFSHTEQGLSGEEDIWLWPN